jgi:hypothetical protein
VQTPPATLLTDRSLVLEHNPGSPSPFWVPRCITLEQRLTMDSTVKARVREEPQPFFPEVVISYVTQHHPHNPD